MKPQRFQLNKDGPERPGVTSRAQRFIGELPLDKSWLIEIKPYRKPRSLKQNAAMWAVAYDTIMEATGLEGSREREQLHSNFCGDFFGWKDVPFIGRKPVRTTTTNASGEPDTIDTETMARFYAFIQRTAADYGICVPDPDPFYHAPRRIP